MAQFVTRCSKKHGREMKMKDLNTAKEGDFPACFDDWSHQNGNLLVITIVVINVIELAFLELGKVLSRHAL